MFYYEEKTVLGKWSPRISHDEKPTEKSAAGTRRKVRNVKEIPEKLRNFDLESLEAYFNGQL